MRRWLPLYALDVIEPNGSRLREERLFCPRCDATVSSRECERCGLTTSSTAVAVACEAVHRPDVGRDDDPPVAPFVTSATCVRAEVVPAALQALARVAPGGALVVDSHMRFLGFLPPGSVDGPSPHASPGLLLAGQLARGRALVVTERVSLHDALRALAAGGARTLAVTNDAGEVRGVVRDLDLLRAWAARHRAAPVPSG